MSQKTKHIYIFKDIKTHLKHKQLKILKKYGRATKNALNVLILHSFVLIL